MTVGSKIPGAVIPRRVFTQPRSKRESTLFGLMSAPTSCGRAAARGYVREGRVEDGAVAWAMRHWSMRLGKAPGISVPICSAIMPMLLLAPWPHMTTCFACHGQRILPPIPLPPSGCRIARQPIGNFLQPLGPQATCPVGVTIRFL